MEDDFDNPVPDQVGYRPRPRPELGTVPTKPSTQREPPPQTLTVGDGFRFGIGLGLAQVLFGALVFLVLIALEVVRLGG